MEAPASSEDVLVYLQAENGEQVALPISALPSDFASDDSGLIMVESSLGEQQEVVVESSAPLDAQQDPTEVPPKKQKRKEPLLTKPLNEEDMELKFHILEEPLYGIPASPKIQKERKRKEYRTKKKIKAAMEKLAQTDKPIEEQPIEEQMAEKQLADEQRVEEEQPAEERPVGEQPAEKKQAERNPTETKSAEEIPDSPRHIKGEVFARRSHTWTSAPPQAERRTRLSNACRVATGKSYKCNDCEYSTERINNIILHIKEKHVQHK